jgi:hypothetical protein
MVSKGVCGMKTPEKKQFELIGEKFYDWYEQDQVEFIPIHDEKNISFDIERISGLIAYVKERKDSF